eukprot:5613443-Pyramimonas_sp.AAC.1
MQRGVVEVVADCMSLLASDLRRDMEAVPADVEMALRQEVLDRRVEYGGAQSNKCYGEDAWAAASP